MSTTYPRVMVTGHRALPNTSALWVNERINAVMDRLHGKYGMSRAISGMALGVDQMFAVAAMERGIAVDAYVPGLDQPSRWSAAQIRRYAELMAKAGTVTDVSDDFPAATYAARLHARNQRMIDSCDLAVVVLDDRRTGGTHSAMAKLTAGDKPTIHINPKTRTVTASWHLQA